MVDKPKLDQMLSNLRRYLGVLRGLAGRRPRTAPSGLPERQVCAASRRTSGRTQRRRGRDLDGAWTRRPCRSTPAGRAVADLVSLEGKCEPASRLGMRRGLIMVGRGRDAGSSPQRGTRESQGGRRAGQPTSPGTAEVFEGRVRSGEAAGFEGGEAFANVDRDPQLTIESAGLALNRCDPTHRVPAVSRCPPSRAGECRPVKGAASSGPGGLQVARTVVGHLDASASHPPSRPDPRSGGADRATRRACCWRSFRESRGHPGT